MDKIEDTFMLEELENLRERLNKDVIENMTNISKEYEDLLSLSTRLDNVIVKYIKSSNNIV